ncbi:MAG: methionyl-tRNA formyltransferase [Gemmatimonadetes bacterium]|nr:methionyl-tRNA formyltransferase [Gemmatimonadota bacterium]
MRIVFFGTPEFAVPSLRALLGEGFDVAAVITPPDKPQGRSRSSLVPPPVKVAALEEGLTVLQPERPSAPDFVAALGALEPTLGVVVAYGHILKPELLAVPPRGVINVHASLLPALRGAAPIQHALLQGFTETGVSIMQMDEGMDTGPVFHRVETPIAPDETGGELTVRLAELGALALVETLELIATGAARPEPQDGALASYAPKITREQARVAWNAPAERIGRLVRALDPKPGAWATLDGREIKLFGPRLLELAPRAAAPGTVLQVEPSLAVAAGDGALELIEVQPAGASRMPVAAWVRGRGVQPGQRFG